MSTAEDFTQLPLLMWEKVFAKVKKAVVFMDDRCAEALHWSGGAAALLQAGARNVKQFSSFEACGENEPKAVFVVSTLLKGRTVDIIKDIISLSHFQYCVVFTAVPHSVHLFANNVSTEMEGFPVFEQFEEKLCEWMGNMNYTAEVMHSPVVFAHVSQQLIVASPFAHLFPLLPADLESINAKRPEKKRFGTLNDLDGHSLPVELQVEIKSLVSALNSMFEAAGMREESFAVGPMSRIIAGELANHNQAKNRRKTAANKASIIFIDRTMDLTGAVGHHGDNLAEKILTVLDPLPGHVTDVQVDMLELTSVQRTPHSQNTVAPGCLAQNHKMSKEKLLENLEKYVEHCKLLEIQGVCASLKSLKFIRKMEGGLKHFITCLQFALGDGDFPAVLRQLLPLMKPRGGEDSSSSGSRLGQDECGPDELILLLIYLYTLAEEVQHFADGGEEELEKLERELIGALTLVVTRETELSPLLQSLTGCAAAEELTTERAHSAVGKMFETLRGLSHMRDHLKQLRSVYTASDGVHQASYRPFLRQVLEEVFHPDRPECPDIEHMSGGLTDLLKTGFSMFMKVSRPRPRDNPLLFLFLVGGVTPSELRLVKDTVAALKPATQVLVLSTRLLRPTDIPELLFSTQRLRPDVGF
uniref:Sec1 family domain containing 2 n=2 Tax=Poecilia reticulata TaxID=8081 RepID=A0A3P9Q3T9_POERE